MPKPIRPNQSCLDVDVSFGMLFVCAILHATLQVLWILCSKHTFFFGGGAHHLKHQRTSLISCRTQKSERTHCSTSLENHPSLFEAPCERTRSVGPPWIQIESHAPNSSQSAPARAGLTKFEKSGLASCGEVQCHSDFSLHLTLFSSNQKTHNNIMMSRVHLKKLAIGLL